MIDRNGYIENRGLYCPFCKAEMVEGNFIQVDDGKAFQDMNCLECENRWQDVYQLVDVIPYRKEQ